VDKSATRGAFTSRAYDSIRRECMKLGFSMQKAKDHAKKAYRAAAAAFDES